MAQDALKTPKVFWADGVGDGTGDFQGPRRVLFEALWLKKGIWGNVGT